MEVGTIFLWGKSTPPAGALELDGSTFDSEQYPELYDHLGTDVLIDMRGEFVRGWGHGRDVGGQSGRAIGGFEDGSKVPIWHYSGGIVYGGPNSLAFDLEEMGYVLGNGYSRNIGSGVSQIYTGRVRPRNKALMFCIQAIAMVGDTYQERVIAALEKIAEGVYHVEDAGEKKPLAKTIALLLAGLNINYCG